MVQDTLSVWGHLDIAVNNAGVNFNHAAEDISDEEWDMTFNVNTKGVLYCCQVFCFSLFHHKLLSLAQHNKVLP